MKSVQHAVLNDKYRVYKYNVYSQWFVLYLIASLSRKESENYPDICISALQVSCTIKIAHFDTQNANFYMIVLLFFKN